MRELLGRERLWRRSLGEPMGCFLRTEIPRKLWLPDGKKHGRERYCQWLSGIEETQPISFFACVFRSRTRWPAIPRNCACDYNPSPTFALGSATDGDNLWIKTEYHYCRAGMVMMRR